MKRYTVSEARMKIAEVLDEAERGEEVLIERRGIRFRILASERPRAKRPLVKIRILDPAIEAGDWTWKWGPGGFTFVPGDGSNTTRASRPGKSSKSGKSRKPR
ncbi:MAG TPA: type II toxin-antitoxin system prevent-host-death family antitoxin [Polyangia bacterium]|nr:type II toxin-antitoxin system prevent-host-death family antitoxin [Polyangia bacterium]